jgi:hypothetical protein
MAEDEVSVSNQMEKEPVIQELSPWMKKRLEERSRPFSPQGLIELLRNGSKLTKSVVKHTGIQDVLSRIGNLGFLSKSYRSIISRAGRAEPPDIYRMLDLPWFRQGGDESPEQRQSSHLHAQEESVSRAITKQSSQPPIKSMVSKQEKTTAYITRLMQPPISRKTAITIGNSIGPNPVKSSHPRIEQKTQVNYLTHSVNVTEQGSVTKTGIPSEISAVKEINRQKDIPRTSGQQPPHVNSPSGDKVKSSRTTFFETGSKGTARLPGDVNKGKSSGITFDKEEQTNTGRRNTPTSQFGYEKREIRLIGKPTKSSSSEQPSTAIRPISMPPALSEKEIDIENETGSSPDVFNSRKKTNDNIKLSTAQHQKTNLSDALPSPKLDSTATNHPIQPDNQEITNFKTVHPDQGRPSKETEHEAAPNRKPADNRIENVKPVSTRQTLDSKDASRRYPAQDLFHKRPLSIRQRIIQSLPLIRNIKRKDNKTFKPVSLINEKRDVLKDNLSLKEIDLIYTNQEPSTPDIPEKLINAASDAGTASKADVVLPQVDRSNDNTTPKDNPPSEVPQIMKKTSWRESIERKEASQIYPVKDLVHTRMHSTRQRVVRSLPLIRNWSKTNIDSHPISNTDERRIESKGSQLTQNNQEISQMPEITAATYVPAPSSPNFRMVADNNITGAYNEVPQNVLQRLPDFNRASNNREMDLILAPANQTNTTRQREDYQSLDQLIHLQRDQSPVLSPSTVQTQTNQTQTQNTTQSTVTQNVENNANQNNNQPDIKALAREVYPLIRRMIIIERERRPSL